MEILYNLTCLIKEYGGRGEVVNAPDCGSGIREFDSHRPPQFYIYRFGLNKNNGSMNLYFRFE